MPREDERSTASVSVISGSPPAAKLAVSTPIRAGPLVRAASLIGRAVARDIDIGAAPKRPARRRQPDLERARRDLHRRLEHDRRQRIAGIDIVIGRIARAAGERIGRGRAGTGEVILRREEQRAVVVLGDLGDAHPLPVEAEPRIGQRHDIHRIEQDVPLVERELIGVTHRLALQPQLRRLARGVEIGEEMRLLRLLGTQPVKIDRRLIRRFDDAGIVLVAAIEEFEPDIVERIGRDAAVSPAPDRYSKKPSRSRYCRGNRRRRDRKAVPTAA